MRFGNNFGAAAADTTGVWELLDVFGTGTCAAGAFDD